MAGFESRRAFEHLDKLAYEIGPRLAGTRGERQAAEYIRGQLEGYGYEVKVQEFEFVEKAARVRIEALLLLAAFTASLPLTAEASLVAFVAALALSHVLPRAVPKRRSQNIVGVLRSEKPKRRLIISAHYDSARCAIGHRLNIFVRLALVPATLVFLICLLARLSGLLPTPWPIAWGCLAVLFLPLCGGMLMSTASKRISPGANDNASGVAVMLETARVAAELRPGDVELAFVAFGAEEQGLHGSRAFAAETSGDVSLNLDAVGVGQRIYYVEGNGIVRRRRTSSEVNRALVRCGGRLKLKLKPMWAILASHDHLPLLRSGFRATTITVDSPGMGKLERLLSKLGLPNAHARRYRYLHTIDDIPDRIELTNVEHVGQIVLEFIKGAT